MLSVVLDLMWMATLMARLLVPLGWVILADED
jgi:hypothetical protein